MNPRSHLGHDDDLRLDYDFSQGVRGKHYEAYREGTNVVFLDADVAKIFTDSASVNQVLRLLVRLAGSAVPGKLRADEAAPAKNRPRKGKRAASRKAAARKPTR